MASSEAWRPLIASAFLVRRLSTGMRTKKIHKERPPFVRIIRHAESAVSMITLGRHASHKRLPCYVWTQCPTEYTHISGSAGGLSGSTTESAHRLFFGANGELNERKLLPALYRLGYDPPSGRLDSRSGHQTRNSAPDDQLPRKIYIIQSVRSQRIPI